jgi:hypothetical protein
VSNSAGSAPSSPGAARRLERLSDNQTEERLPEKRLEEQHEEDHDQRAQPQSLDHQLFGTRVQASGEPFPIGQSNQLFGTSVQASGEPLPIGQSKSAVRHQGAG